MLQVTRRIIIRSRFYEILRDATPSTRTVGPTLSSTQTLVFVDFGPFCSPHRRCYFIHHGWYSDSTKFPTLGARAKIFIANSFGRNVAVSNAVADYIGGRCIVIPNPLNQSVFFENESISRTHNCLFVGRLVTDKGGDLLIHAAHELRRRGHPLSFTVIGSGPAEESLQSLARKLDVADLFRFEGKLPAQEVAAQMNSHRILVVPSRVTEGFGMVALEGIACGCVVVASNKGGLRDAVGDCGSLFSSGCAISLANAIEARLGTRSPDKQTRRRSPRQV